MEMISTLKQNYYVICVRSELLPDSQLRQPQEREAAVREVD